MIHYTTERFDDRVQARLSHIGCLANLVSSHWCSDALGNIEQHQMTCMANMELCVNCVWSVYVCACVYQCMPGTV